MDLHPDLVRQLNQLSEGLDDGTDLHAILTVLADDLLASIPQFLGLDLHLTVADTSIILSTMTPDTGDAVQASLLLPLDAMGVTHSPNSTLTYYASRREAFSSLAIDVRRAFDLDGQVVLDGHLEPATGPPGRVAGLDELSIMNQAIGILIGRLDLTVDRARHELQRLAEEHHQSRLQIAHRLIDRTDAFDEGPTARPNRP